MTDQEGEEKELLTERYGSSLQSLRVGLEQKWKEKKIDSLYQRTILTYLGTLNPEQAKLQIIKEHEKLLSNRSPALKIQQLMAERDQIMARLLTMLSDENDMEDACQSLDDLRKINLKICEAIFAIKEQKQASFPNSKLVLVGYGAFFQKLNSDNIPVLQSYLRNYISFTHTYDPFFLYPYERIEAEGLNEDTPDPIIKLFKMNISYVYRLIKIKNEIIKFLTTPYEDKQNLTFKKTQKQSQITQQERYQNKSSPGTAEQNQAKLNTTYFQPDKKVISEIKRFETINPGEEDSQEYPRKFKRKLLHRSQPKNTRRFSDIPKIESEGNEERSKLIKFKIREYLEQQRQPSNLRHRTQNYEITEDEEINMFRKKMLARREKRKRISIFQKKQEDSQIEFLQIKKRSLDLNRSSIKNQNYSQPFIAQSKSKISEDQEEIGSSQSEEQPMQPRGIESTSPAHKKYSQGRLAGQFKIKQSIKSRRERIKLEPIVETSILKNELSQAQLNEEKTKRGLRMSEKYHPISPQIKQMNKQSSSSNNSDKKLSESDEAYTGKRQEELFSKVCRQNEENQKSGYPKNIFRIKKKTISETSEQINERSKWAQGHSFTPIEETNQEKFKDGHIRTNNILSGDSSKMRGPMETGANLVITKKLMNETERPSSSSRKVQKQSPSRLGSRHHELGFNRQKYDTSPHRDNLSNFSDRLRQAVNQQQKSSNLASKQAEQKILKQIEEELDESNNKKKQIKMKPGQIKLADLYAFIQKQKINEFQRQQFEVGLWKQNINLKQSYLTKFYMNSELAAFGISSPRCDGDYSILYWGTTCPQNFTTFLFRKYLDYLEKFTNLNNIYIGSPGYTDADFHKKGSSFVRGRKKYQKRELPYVSFLSLECSNICFEQKTNNQHSLFFSQQIEQFSPQNSKSSNFMTLCDFQDAKIKLPQKSSFHQNINSISEVNRILENFGVDTYATSEKIQIKQCKLFILKDNCAIKSNYFYVRDGYFVPKGVQIYSKQKQKILKLEMNKQQYFLYFGKKFQNVEAFLNMCSPKANGPTEFFAFKMFSKQLYGRIKNNDVSGLGCYGNWDINFLWQDQLKGTVIKDMPSPQYILGPQNYHVAIFKGDVLLLGFEVKPSDFFF